MSTSFVSSTAPRLSTTARRLAPAAAVQFDLNVIACPGSSRPTGALNTTASPSRISKTAPPRNGAGESLRTVASSKSRSPSVADATSFAPRETFSPETARFCGGRTTKFTSFAPRLFARSASITASSGSATATMTSAPPWGSPASHTTESVAVSPGCIGAATVRFARRTAPNVPGSPAQISKRNGTSTGDSPLFVTSACTVTLSPGKSVSVSTPAPFTLTEETERSGESALTARDRTARLSNSLDSSVASVLSTRKRKTATPACAVNSKVTTATVFRASWPGSGALCTPGASGLTHGLCADIVTTPSTVLLSPVLRTATSTVTVAPARVAFTGLPRTLKVRASTARFARRSPSTRSGANPLLSSSLASNVARPRSAYA